MIHVALALVLLLPAGAAASGAMHDEGHWHCATHLPETMSLTRLSVREGGQRIDPPPWLPDAGELSSRRDEALLSTPGATQAGARISVFDKLRPIEPSATQRRYIDWLSEQPVTADPRCDIVFHAYRPLLPGRPHITRDDFTPSSREHVHDNLCVVNYHFCSERPPLDLLRSMH